jgi:hypothetical protein
MVNPETVDVGKGTSTPPRNAFGSLGVGGHVLRAVMPFRVRREGREQHDFSDEFVTLRRTHVRSRKEAEDRLFQTFLFTVSAGLLKSCAQLGTVT